MATVKFRITGKPENPSTYFKLLLGRNIVFEKKTDLSIK